MNVETTPFPEPQGVSPGFENSLIIVFLRVLMRVAVGAHDVITFNLPAVFEAKGIIPTGR